MAFQRPSLNVQQPIVDRSGLPTQPFLIFMRGVREDLDAAPTGFTPVALTGQTASIGTTSIPTDGDLSAGLYRLSWYVQVITPAGVTSDFQVTIAWTFNGITQSKIGTLTAGNTTATKESNSVPLMSVDAATPITYALVYNSNPAAAMVFDLYITLERMALL